MLKIGNRIFEERIVGAPLAGVTDIAFRKVIRDIYRTDMFPSTRLFPV